MLDRRICGKSAWWAPRGSPAESKLESPQMVALRRARCSVGPGRRCLASGAVSGTPTSVSFDPAADPTVVWRWPSPSAGPTFRERRSARSVPWLGWCAVLRGLPLRWGSSAASPSPRAGMSSVLPAAGATVSPAAASTLVLPSAITATSSAGNGGGSFGAVPSGDLGGGAGGTRTPSELASMPV